MNLESKSTFLHTLLYFLVTITCVALLYTTYSDYKKEQVGQETFERLRNDILVEIDIVYQNQVFFETQYWRSFYSKLEDSVGYRKYHVSKDEFTDLQRSMFPYNDADFYFKSAHWEKAKMHPEFMKRLRPSQLRSLQEFYDYQEETEMYFNRVNEVMTTLFYNRKSDVVLENQYEYQGTFLNDAFMLDLLRANLFMYAEGIYRNTFDLPVPEHYEALRKEFNASANREIDPVTDSIP